MSFYRKNILAGNFADNIAHLQHFQRVKRGELIGY